ncbi:MAG TPA: ribonuclease D [Nitrospinaceae bacterium]|nr:ribonuclease D [Nitrospinaceae bacterium]
MYLTTEKDLADFCEQLRSSPTLAIDTEFVRERTYYHKLGLIQVSDGTHFAAIDPIYIFNLEPLLDLIRNHNTVKVFHAARQDLEILYRLCGEMIQPIFDTQIAAAVVGWGAQISFAKIVNKVLGKKIDKSETYTDWCEYAIDDVRLLFPVYEDLKKVLKKLNREEWLQGEFIRLEDPNTFNSSNLEKLCMRIKNIRTLAPKNFAIICELAQWREKEAQDRDCLAKTIVRDESLLELARKAPIDIEGLNCIRGLHKNEIKRSNKNILAAIQRGLKIPLDQITKLPELEIYKAPPGIEEILSALVQIKADQLNIEPSVLADRKKVNNFVKCFDQNLSIKNHPLFSGWRKEAIGDQLYLALSGKTALAIGENGKLIDFPIDLNLNKSTEKNPLLK